MAPLQFLYENEASLNAADLGADLWLAKNRENAYQRQVRERRTDKYLL